MTERNLCIVFAEVTGRALLDQKLGITEAQGAVKRCLNRVERVIAACSGRVVERIDDGIMAVFDEPEDGVQAAFDMQQRVQDLPKVSGFKLSIRVGCNYGPVLEAGGRVTGDAVALAARMAVLAEGGQIVATGETIADLALSSREIETMTVKGRRDALRVCEVLWQGGEVRAAKPAVAAKPAPAPAAATKARLRLRYDNKELTLDARHQVASLGRDLASDIAVNDPRASRHHCRIELRGDSFVLIDQSTNGTFVSRKGGDELILRRDELVLSDSGSLSFGQSKAENKGVLLEFEVLA